MGSALLSLLLEDPEVSEVISVGRKSTGISHPKLREVLIRDLSELLQHSAELRADRYFCCLGTTIRVAGSQENFRKVDYQAVVDFAKIASAHGASTFVLVSSTGANARSPFFYPRVKGEVEEVVKKLDFARLRIFRPSFLMGERKELRRGERAVLQIFKGLRPVMPTSVQKVLFTEVPRLARRMLEESKSEGQDVRVFEPREI